MIRFKSKPSETGAIAVVVRCSGFIAMSSSKNRKTSSFSDLYEDVTSGDDVVLESGLCRDDIDLDAIALATESDSITSGNKSVHLEESVSAPPPGDLDTDYERLTVVAEGGQATVYRARDRFFNRTVAVKSLHRTLLGNQTARDGFIAEARLMAQLDHPAIVPVYNVCEDQNHGLHLVMKLVDGKSMRNYLKKISAIYSMIPARVLRFNEKKSLAHRLNIFNRICDAISFAHYKGVLHHDLKPENIIFGHYNEVYVLDWGMAIRIGVPEDAAKCRARTTLNYTAPEVLAGKPYDQRSELYALGLILYELVFLKQPFPGTDAELCNRILDHKIRSFRHKFRYPIDHDLKKIVQKAIDPNPQLRYSSILELMEDLRHYQLNEPVCAVSDAWFSGFRHWFVRNRKLVMLGCVLLTLVCLAVTSFSLYREIRVRQREYHRSIQLTQVYSNGLESGNSFNSRIRVFESRILALSRECTALLAGGIPGGKSLPTYTVSDADALKVPELTYSPCYGQDVSFDEFVYKESPGAPVAQLNTLLARLAPLKYSFYELFVDSLPPALRASMRDQSLKKYMIEHKTPLNFVCVSLENGLHLSYPYHRGYRADYDPRQRSWYRRLAGLVKNDTLWFEPYIDGGDQKLQGEIVVSGARKIVDYNGKMIGSVLFDVSLQALTDMLASSGNQGKSVISKLLVDRNGYVIADTSGQLTPVKKDGQLVFRYFPDNFELRNMWAQRQGVRFRFSGNQVFLNFFMTIDSLGWLYVERIDYGKLLDE